MRRITRLALSTRSQSYLRTKQSAANDRRKSGALNIETMWRNARATRALATDVLGVLYAMAGPRQRCMYCLDSRGCDIDHFYPKTPFPNRVFRWKNLLICCADCNRFKDDKFPVRGGRPLLIDPTADDPWLHLDFVPATGKVTARFDVQLNDFAPKGLATIEALHLDRREALDHGHKQSFERLCHTTRSALSALEAGGIVVTEFVDELRRDDEHGLLAWCFGDRGQNVEPFRTLYCRYQAIWAACVQALQ